MKASPRKFKSDSASKDPRKSQGPRFREGYPGDKLGKLLANCSPILLLFCHISPANIGRLSFLG